jgi:hypothetical protein
VSRGVTYFTKAFPQLRNFMSFYDRMGIFSWNFALQKSKFGDAILIGNVH